MSFKQGLTKIADLILLSTPVQSNASESCIPAAPLICFATSSGFAVFSICTVLTVGRSFLANSSRDGKRSVMTMGVQPAARAARRVTNPIGPAPLSMVNAALENEDIKVGVYLPNGNRVPQSHTSPVKTGQRHCKRLTQGSFFVRHVIGETVAPSSRVIVISSECTMVRRGGEEDDSRT